ncbi:MAG: hypothetical protein QM669_06790 [Siphonobacter sp.]
MNNYSSFFRRILVASVSAVLLVIPSVSKAQVAFGLHGTIASPSIDGAKTRGGAGANLKVFLSPNVAVGVAAKYISLSYDAYEIGTSKIQSVGSLIPLTGSLDFYLASGALRPYVGVEAGAYIHRYDLRYNGDNLYNTSNTRAGATPKLGLTFSAGNFGIFAEGNYHFIFSNKNGSANVGSFGNISYDNPDKLWGINVGVIFGLPN